MDDSQPPKSDEQLSDQKPQSVFGVIVHSFFVIPFLLAVFSVLLLTAVRILTMEKRTVYDYLEDVKVGGLTKRWQSAFELSKILANPDLIPRDQRFSHALVIAFAKSKDDDPRVRQYLSLAMARTGNPEFVPVLLKSLDKEKNENLHAIIYALGILKDKRAVDVLLNYLEADNPHIRLATTIALGNIGDPKTMGAIRNCLNDPEPNVQWDAAIALAKMHDVSGKEILLNLLDRNYLSRFSALDSQEQTHIMVVTIETTAPLNIPEINAQLQKLFRTDKNMKVRRVAFEALRLNQVPLIHQN